MDGIGAQHLIGSIVVVKKKNFWVDVLKNPETESRREKRKEKNERWRPAIGGVWHSVS
jgi:hypothetical protein